MNSENKKLLNYWDEVVQKYKNKDRNESEEAHYQHALKMVKDLSGFSESEAIKKSKKIYNYLK